MDPTFDDDQLLTNLIRFEPSDKEREALQNYINNPENQQSALSIPDQFCLEVCKSCKCMCEQGKTYAHVLEKTISIERYHERMETMLFKSMFRDKINHVEQVIALLLIRSRLIYVHILMYALRFQQLTAVLEASKSVRNATNFTDLLTVSKPVDQTAGDIQPPKKLTISYSLFLSWATF